MSFGEGLYSVAVLQAIRKSKRGAGDKQVIDQGGNVTNREVLAVRIIATRLVDIRLFMAPERRSAQKNMIDKAGDVSNSGFVAAGQCFI